jgi:Icc-related predicted phosphoesterase
MIKLGIIACAHGNYRAVERLRREYEKKSVDAIALCGDIGADYRQILAVLKAAKGRKPVIALPGSHEPAKDYKKAVRAAGVVDGTAIQRVTIKNYDIIIQPGSSVNAPKAGYRIGDRPLPKKYRKRFLLFPPQKLAKIVRKPSKTVLLCHDPPKCTGKKAIDNAHSGIATKTFRIGPMLSRMLGINKRPSKPKSAAIQKGTIMPEPVAALLAKLGCPISIRHRNAGSTAIRQFVRRYGIRFIACGHIHESGQKAVNSAGRALRQGQWSTSTWYNAASAAEGKGGMLFVKDSKGAFRNIVVKA